MENNNTPANNAVNNPSPQPTPAPEQNQAPSPEPYQQQPQQQNYQSQPAQQPQQGQHHRLTLPPELKKWNWGAFVYNIMWGIGHKVYSPLLCLIPFFGVIWIFICGARGNQWLWESGQYSNTTELLNSQKSWNRAGFVGFFIFLAIIILEFVVFIPILSMAGMAASTSTYTVY